MSCYMNLSEKANKANPAVGGMLGLMERDVLKTIPDTII